MKNSEVCVPVAALSLPGESGSIAPTQGDEVDINGTATVSRVEGDKAYLALKTINGEAVEAAEEKGEMSLDDEEAEMRSDARGADQNRIY